MSEKLSLGLCKRIINSIIAQFVVEINCNGSNGLKNYISCYKVSLVIVPYGGF